MEEEGQTKDVHPCARPSQPIILICVLKDNIQTTSVVCSFLFTPIWGLLGKIPPPPFPSHLVFSADAALGFTQELQKTALLNILHLFHRATVGYSSRSRR